MEKVGPALAEREGTGSLWKIGRPVVENKGMQAGPHKVVSKLASCFTGSKWKGTGRAIASFRVCPQFQVCLFDHGTQWVPVRGLPTTQPWGVRGLPLWSNSESIQNNCKAFSSWYKQDVRIWGAVSFLKASLLQFLFEQFFLYKFFFLKKYSIKTSLWCFSHLQNAIRRECAKRSN